MDIELTLKIKGQNNSSAKNKGKTILLVSFTILATLMLLKGCSYVDQDRRFDVLPVAMESAKATAAVIVEMLKPLGDADRKCLDVAEGWLAISNHLEANEGIE